jgi:hypothetical protein
MSRGPWKKIKEAVTGVKDPVEEIKTSDEEVKNAEIKKRILSTEPKLYLFVGYDKGYDECVKEFGVRWINIRDKFYEEYIAKKVGIPKYPYTVKDSFVNRVVNACIEVLDKNYKYNKARIAASRYFGLELKEDGDFFRLVDKILADNFKEFFTYTLKYPTKGTWVFGGVNHKFEVDYLKTKFGADNICVLGDVDFADKKVTDVDDLVGVFCA